MKIFFKILFTVWLIYTFSIYLVYNGKPNILIWQSFKNKIIINISK